LINSFEHIEQNWQQKFRYHIGVKPYHSIPELWFLRIFVYLLISGAFALTLLTTWGLTTFYFKKVLAALLQGFTVVKITIIPLRILIALFIFSIGGIGGGIVKTSFFPSIASDRVVVNLKMVQGTNEMITDSIISEIENIAWQVNDTFTKKQTGNVPVIQNIIKRIGPGSSNGSLTINLLPEGYCCTRFVKK